MLLDLMYRMLGVDEEDGPRRLFAVARGVQSALPYVVLSLLDGEEGVRFGPASRDELARARARHAYYVSMARELTAVPGLAVMKGPALAQWYPPGVLRGHSDIDLVAADEATLWRAVKSIVDRAPVDRADVAVIGGQRRHVVVTLEWESTDPLVDPAYGADLSTAAFVGDFGAVPIRAALPADPVVAGLLSVAEERFQRSFLPRDVIDVAMLAAAPLPPLPAVLEAIGESCRGPEVAELLRYAGDHVPLGSLSDLLDALPSIVERERARRASASAPGGAGASGSVAGDVTDVPAEGSVARGFPLGPVGWRDVPDATVERFSHGHVLRTPIGDYLLTGESVVTRAAYEAAIAYCAGETSRA